MHPWLEASTWAAATADLRDYRRRGFGGLLTEDKVRFAAIRALAEAGVDPARMRVEWPHPTILNSRIDLAVLGGPEVAFLEFKFPREPNEQNAAWTMALGAVLHDIYRLAAIPSPARRLFVYVESARLRRYMAGAAQRIGLNIDTSEVALTPGDAARLPTTAAKIIGVQLATHHVGARRIALVDVDETLRLSVYDVDGLGDAPDPTAARLVKLKEPPLAVERLSDPPVDMPAGTRTGVRREILDAVHDLLTRSGRSTFTPTEIVTEMSQRGTGYAESTIRTMVTAHMCANAPNNSAAVYSDLERIDRGVYRLFVPSATTH